MADAEALLEPLIPALRRYAYALLRDHDAADDLVQDTLERALSRWTLRRRDGDLRAWLFTIQRNLYVSALRQGQRRGAHVELDEATTPSTVAQQESGIEVQDILATLDQLPEEQKSLLLLVGVEELSYDDAAKIMGVPLGTVMSRLSRGRQRLRALLETGRTTLLRRVK
ncbi:sigma-70 family RNA polymerase sigma factor [Reyranella sp.]|jgi:RNA polymerase sigma-70 factor (ECF subfamily)|uniref:sigma-70 family RNA polymerase sigma factor n=1 Tax=Reyranella sp. TaxID=1929291 RepID=UPI000BCC0CF5|nr:sigma-70 family RNA polymerase sigma factor [Reyranella sp.]OYY35450.1 MAG: RNA polymerase subunit sigma-24 [Rhodospirillales bacterium 35-66-84]OYZ96656.1 MAG: RNA polymerase subunit sigma-24 [Rhodospirillales bacterium 24-66-33]OZB28016.1 MAG: RNA polymerase subunit sigma-24 [Rhodospirillales bacterium 39-66-50]HQS18488.1 sigma-70 family RNA polymerase sigma factor [Reyranella sp.]HQT10019.1 sigma-70 family RNA polymerase sigma factor [Reyranella sp.]